MKRKSRVTADITKEAHDLLRATCLMSDCSKGKIIEKMIRKFCVETSADVEVKALVKAETVKPVKRFVPPKFFDVDEYMRTRMCPDPITQAEKFCDFYESNGWKVGKNKMKCWKAAVRNWLKGYKAKSTGKDIIQESSNSDWHLNDQGF